MQLTHRCCAAAELQAKDAGSTEKAACSCHTLVTRLDGSIQFSIVTKYHFDAQIIIILGLLPLVIFTQKLSSNY